MFFFFFFSGRRRHTRLQGDWSSDVCSSDLPVHESPLHLVPYTLRPKFRETYGVEITGELCPLCRARMEDGRANLNAPEAAARRPDGIAGDFMKMPIERIFISEAGRMGIGTYAPHDPTTADIADLV